MPPTRAARWTMSVGRWSLTISSAAPGTVRSWSALRTPPGAAPRPRKRATTHRPRNPAPPVTTTRRSVQKPGIGSGYGHDGWVNAPGRVVAVNATGECSGAESVLVSLLAMAAARGVDVVVVSPAGPLVDRLPAGVRHVPIAALVPAPRR